MIANPCVQICNFHMGNRPYIVHMYNARECTWLSGHAKWSSTFELDYKLRSSCDQNLTLGTKYLMDIHMKQKMTELIQVQLHLVKGIIVVLQEASTF